MIQTVYATYNGHCLEPEEKIDLLANQRYLIRIELIKEEKPVKKENILQKLSSRAMDLGISDLAEQHDHYLYGTPKR